MDQMKIECMPVKKIVLLSALLSASNAAFAMPPTCESAASDPDGDGWGYENSQSCRVSDSSSSGGGNGDGQSACLNPGISDPDGDGYGWENNQTCVVNGDSSGGDSGGSFSIDTLNQQLLGLLQSRRWQCKAESIVVGGEDNFQVRGWSSLQHCGAASCPELVTTSYEFGKNGQYQATVVTDTRGGTSTANASGSYGFVHGYNFFLDSQSFFRYGVERGDFTTNPDEYFVFYTSQDKRTACKGL